MVIHNAEINFKVILILLGLDGDMGLPLIAPMLMVMIGMLKSSLMHLQISKFFSNMGLTSPNKLGP